MSAFLAVAIFGPFVALGLWLALALAVAAGKPRPTSDKARDPHE